MTLPSASASASPMDVRGGVELPARRSDVELRTADGLTLVGELALPLDRDPVAALVTLHPLPTAGGFMDSHVIRKAAARARCASRSVTRLTAPRAWAQRATAAVALGSPLSAKNPSATAMRSPAVPLFSPPSVGSIGRSAQAGSSRSGPCMAS